jgi:uracil-DNA glycosylase
MAGLAPGGRTMSPPRAKVALPALRAAIRECRNCDLWAHATQAVSGEGVAGARLMLVGEQPGDAEDREGRPFVGPAGKLLDRALAAAGIDRGLVYVTNAVKHFKWTPRGKRRMHSKPNAGEVEACRPWLEAEIRALRPEVIVCLGATAAQALLGREFRVTAQRGEWHPSPLAPHVMATFHPAALLRLADEHERHEAMLQLVADLAKAAQAARTTRDGRQSRRGFLARRAGDAAIPRHSSNQCAAHGSWKEDAHDAHANNRALDDRRARGSGRGGRLGGAARSKRA